MRRSAVLFLMLFAMLWQSVATARVGSTVNPLADLWHASLHWQESAHHHHDDGSFHVDDSSESVQHVVCDNLNTTAALAAGAEPRLSLAASCAPIGLQEQPAPHPYIDGLLRPPRVRS